MTNIDLGFKTNSNPSHFYLEQQNELLSQKMHESFLAKEKIKESMQIVFSTSEFSIFNKQNDQITSQSNCSKLLRSDNDRQILIMAPSGLSYYCNKHTYFNYWLQAKMRSPNSYTRSSQPQTGPMASQPIASNVTVEYYEHQSKTPKEGLPQTFERGCSGLAYNLISCMIDFVSDLPKDILIEADDNFVANSLSAAFNYEIHEPHIHELGILTEDYQIKTIGVDQKKRNMMKRLNAICEENNIYFSLTNYRNYIRSKTIISECNVDDLADPIFGEIFHCIPIQRYHLTEIDEEYHDGHHETELITKPLETISMQIEEEKKITRYGYMRYTSYTYTKYDAIYIDGTKGKKYTMSSESEN